MGLYLGKSFNVAGKCCPEMHYMVNLSGRLEEIKTMIDAGQYFCMNRARQYGKTTTLSALEEFLKEEYTVVSLDFQMISYADFENEGRFITAFSREVLEAAEDIPEQTRAKLTAFADGAGERDTLSLLFKCLSEWCKESTKKLVLIIDEVDSAANNQVFLDFLAQLRGYYLKRGKSAVFHSVVLAGVYDIKSIKYKIQKDDGHKYNSPWNIAVDFLVDMSFSAADIAGMLEEYEADHGTGMDIGQIAELIYDYTSGYPFLVSGLCKLVDEQLSVGSAWTREGVLESVRILLSDQNTLFDSLINKLEDYPELEIMLRDMLFRGKEIPYVVGVRSIETAVMFGFAKKIHNRVVIANRIFETLLYDLFLAAPAVQQEQIYDEALRDKNQFICNGHLNMERVLEKFVMHFDDIYGDRQQSFVEEDGRRYFLLYLRPIINGVGNYYVESWTRNMERTDVIIDYRGEQFVVELKIWRGSAYHERGEKQLLDYLDYYHLDKGYMLSFSFNKKKQPGIKEWKLGEKTLIEAVV